MMKVKVIKSFIDKYTEEVYNIDDVIDCSEKRYNEIIKVGNFVEKITKKEKESKENGNETTNI